MEKVAVYGVNAKEDNLNQKNLRKDLLLMKFGLLTVLISEKSNLNDVKKDMTYVG